MNDSHLLIFGLGYTGAAVARAALAEGISVAATTRDPARAPLPGLRLVAFADAAAEIARATHLLATAPPDEGADGVDPVLAAHGAAIAAAPRLRWVGYLSTTGVYGDRDGGWVDEATPPAPAQDAQPAAAGGRAGVVGAGRRGSRSICSASQASTGRAARRWTTCAPAGRGASSGPATSSAASTATTSPRAVLAAMRTARARGVRVLNLADDEPAESAAVVEEAARLLGLPPPPAVPFAAHRAGTMSPMARSFWQENRRVVSARDPGDARPRLALSELPRGATRHPRRRAASTMRHSSARSCRPRQAVIAVLEQRHLHIRRSPAVRPAAARSPTARPGRAGRAAAAPGSRAGSARPAADAAARPRSARA